MRPIALLVSALLINSVAGLANGEEVERYRLEKTETGYVRMDTTTGEMSICEERSGELVCRVATDERTAYQDEIDRLQAKLDGLEERVVKLESQPGLPDALVPSEEEFDRSMDMMEKFFRRFMGIAKDLENNKSEPGAQPQKT